MKKEEKKRIRTRGWLLLGFFFVLYVALLSRAVQIQFFSARSLKDLAVRQHTTVLTLQPERGQILDRHGTVLAASLLVDSLWADPSRIDKREETAACLSAALDLPRKTVREKLSQGRRFSWIRRMISPEQADRVRSLNLDGVFLVKEPKRFYTNRSLAAHLLGCVGYDSKGLEGLELFYDGILTRPPRRVVWGRDAKGQRFYQDMTEDKVDPSPSCNLILTIDSRIQHAVEERLQEAVAETGARGGLVIVMDPGTGEILAMANAPVFNPNVFTAYDREIRKNRGVLDSFDPGSTFKPFLMAAAFEEGVISENEEIDCEKGLYTVGRKTIHEALGKRYEILTPAEILKYSSNIGCAKIADRLGAEKFHRWIRNFGFGQKTGIDLPGEASGILRDPDRWTTVDLATIGFGQGISVTAVQLVTAMAAIANDGVLVKPRIVRGIVDDSGAVIREFEPEVVRRVLSPQAAWRMTGYLRNVVEAQDGTGRNARIADVAVAGKTGTSQKLDRETGQYSPRKVRASFIGFFPADRPRMVVYVMLDEPETRRWGGQAAAPLFRKVSEQIIRGFDEPVGAVVAGPRGKEEEIRKISSGTIFSMTAEHPRSAYPDFRGKTLSEVLKIAAERGIETRLAGSGWAVRQDPGAGTPLDGEPLCRVWFDPGEQRAGESWKR